MSHDHSSKPTVSSTGLSLILPTIIFLTLLGAGWFYIGSSCTAKPSKATESHAPKGGH